MPYADILEKLENRLGAINRRIQLIEEIKSSGRKASEEETSFLDERQDPYTKEEICLMLQAKSSRRASKGKEYQPILLDNSRSQENFIDLLAGMRGKAFHYDIIVKEDEGVHCTPLQISSDGNEAKIFYIDAVGGKENFHMKERMEDALGVKAHQNVSVGSQRDQFSCAIFSLKDLNTMSKLSSEDLERSLSDDPEKKISDETLHERFIKNSQSLSLTSKYNQQAIVSKAATLADYLQDYTITVEISETASKDRNYAILYKTKQYLEYALKVLEDLPPQQRTDEQLNQIIEQRSGEIIVDQLRSAMEPDFKEIAERYDLLNNKQIELIAKYGLDREPLILRNLPCFQNMATTEEICEVIDKIFHDGEISEQRKVEALGVIEKVKDFADLNQVKAVLYYGLDPEEVKLAKCFISSGDEAMKQLYNACNLAPENKMQAAQEMFDKIRDLNNSNLIRLVVEYGIDPALASKTNFIINQHLEKEFEIGAAADAFNFIDHWYKQAGSKGAEAAFKTLTKMFDKKMVALSKVKKITSIEKPDKLALYFKSGSNKELMRMWQAFASQDIEAPAVGGVRSGSGSFDKENTPVALVKARSGKTLGY